MAVMHHFSDIGVGGGSKVAATAELLKTVVFSWRIGNGDLHGKNLSIYDPDGVWQPTPAYDLLCTQPYAVDELVGAAYDWPDRCVQIGFDDRRTELLAEMPRTS
ncbi:hypothetical protein GCM10009632_11580 [Mycolicibacterium alvei]|uniref:HipA-like C-terminal domain-containing protein n=1 Tax=Mycolicibacterium alvei TaxID=67081 RepID=A0A6N4UX08_9MYCO|nr:HipA domain-containing protein [Mycolicibacterium alvei]MCV7002090.1 HipA domain-containing protein [Mycolicibacterium alvei]BBX27972.1 hypothetical protein MALV_30970 [Mycolicibacterium alvei]